MGLGSTTIYEEGEGADERLEVNLAKLLKVDGVFALVLVLNAFPVVDVVDQADSRDVCGTSTTRATMEA